jgi:hypothetical protein
MALPGWMVVALYATGAMNLGAAAAFSPPAHALRALAGFPDDGHPLYRAVVAALVLLFGLAYLAAARAGRADRLFIALAAAGKLAFVTIVVAYWAAGSVPAAAALLATADLPFAALFVVWLSRST